jgi:bifunctional ADP-heptose synthase (sugar kinase/adenylyltransferase)
MAITSGYPINDAIELANKAGGIVVGKAGTAVVTAEELKAETGHFCCGYGT